jgi:hypothetical protein
LLLVAQHGSSGLILIAQQCLNNKLVALTKFVSFGKQLIFQGTKLKMDEVGEVIFILWGAMCAHHKRSRSYK